MRSESKDILVHEMETQDWFCLKCTLTCLCQCRGLMCCRQLSRRLLCVLCALVSSKRMGTWVYMDTRNQLCPRCREQVLTCPIADRAVSIREEVISLERPRVVVAVLDGHILCGSGVEGIDATILIQVVDQLIHVLVILVGRHPLKIRAEGDQDVIPICDQ